MRQGQQRAAVRRRGRAAHPLVRGKWGARCRPGRLLRRDDQALQSAGAAQPGTLSVGLHIPDGRPRVRGFKVAICNLEGRPSQHRKYLPLAFTEHGAIMAASQLGTEVGTPAVPI
jgi:hypothetical protein